QPPHPGFFLGHNMDPAPTPAIYTVDGVQELDKRKLEELINDAKSISNADGTYTADSYAELQAAIELAEEVLVTIDSQEALEASLEDLQNAIDGLVEDDTADVDVSELEELINDAKSISNADGT